MVYGSKLRPPQKPTISRHSEGGTTEESPSPCSKAPIQTFPQVGRLLACAKPSHPPFYPERSRRVGQVSWVIGELAFGRHCEAQNKRSEIL